MLNEQEALYRAFFTTIHQASFLLDQNGRFLAVNKAAERLAGYTAHESQAMRYEDLCAPDQVVRCRAAFQQALAGALHELDTAIISKEGRRIELHLVSGPMTVYGTAGLFVMAYKLPDKDQAVGPFVHASIFQDEVARRTEAERQLQTLASELTMAENRERERIAVILHNDLQQVLVALKYHIASLVKRTDQQATEICLLVDEALDISRSLITELSPPALRNGLAAALEWLVAWMSQKLGFAVTLRVENISPITKEVESFAFQAVRELLLNAAKHSNARAARVQAQMNEEILELAVEDEGIGFHPSGLRNDPGKIGGLGLASIQERVALLGGKMEIQSAPGKGSQFRLQLPCRPTSRDGASQNNERL